MAKITLKEAWCQVAEWLENPPWDPDDVRSDEEIKAIALACILENVSEDLDEQTLNVNCDSKELEISNGNNISIDDLRCESRLVWRVDPTVAKGFKWETWSGADASGTGTDEVAFENAWSGTVADGIPGHLGDTAPTASGFETDTRFSQSDSGQDEHRLTYWVYNDTSAPFEISDTDTRAEALAVYAGCDCPSSLVHKRYYNEGSPYNSQGPFITLQPGSLVKLTVLIHDHSAFSGFRLRGNLIGSTTTFDVTSYQERPSIECDIVKDSECDPYILAEGESYKPLAMDCLDCGEVGEPGLSESDVQALIDAQDHDDPEPSTVLPLPDGDPGAVGTSLDYARADHVHPCPEDLPLLPYDDLRPTLVGPATELASQNFDRDSTSDTLEYTYRIRFTADSTTNGWVYIQAAPNPAGFQLMSFDCKGVYYQTGSQDVNDAGVNPFHEQLMGGNGVSWTTNRIYYLHFSAARKFENTGNYAVVKATYKKVT